MVLRQLMLRGITDERVLKAFRSVPRDRFIPQGRDIDAYQDHPIPIGLGQTTSQPYIIARMLELATIHAADRVLEVGTGSGYQTALLAELASQVFSIERFAELASRAEAILGEIGYNNVHVTVGDGSCGWEEWAPFDAVVVSAAAPWVPPPLKEQLAADGRLVLPVGGTFMQNLVRIVRHESEFREELHEGCTFVPLVGEHGHAR
ncbi:MAG: protein-L-isoaspartate(D-aspartate) O-methyltransferase [Candidatus Schekmanbacteria bacterium]|nr:protein-L-isoaspartate(D-aspartate) O-methyltransferase [Candidatus Schekmanbacteria bacterium]